MIVHVFGECTSVVTEGRIECCRIVFNKSFVSVSWTRGKVVCHRRTRERWHLQEDPSITSFLIYDTMNDWTQSQGPHDKATRSYSSCYKRWEVSVRLRKAYNALDVDIMTEYDERFVVYDRWNTS